MKINTIEVFALSLPLVEPYRMSFGDMTDFDMTLVRVTADSGMTALGEATANPGYSGVSADDIWSYTVTKAPELIGRDIRQVTELLKDDVYTAPEQACALMSASESLALPEVYMPETSFSIPLLATVNAVEHKAIVEEVRRFIHAGYTTLKVKVGWDVDKDIAKVRLIQKTAGENVSIRLDANQGYGEEAAETFVRAIAPQGIELFEQPFDPDWWEPMARLKSISALPLMLDESIHGEKELEKAIRMRCADYVKFKLNKAGSMGRLVALINRARQAGLGVVVGNGVAGEVGCYAEAAVMRGFASAGENNGFMKQRGRLFNPPLDVADGYLHIPPKYMVGFTTTNLSAVTRSSRVFQ